MISSMLKRAIVVQDERAADEELRSWYSSRYAYVRNVSQTSDGFRQGRLCRFSDEAQDAERAFRGRAILRAREKAHGS